RLLAAIDSLGVSLAERMRRRGFRRAADFRPDRWRRQFGEVVEAVLDLPPRPLRRQVEVRARNDRLEASAAVGEVLVAVQVCNLGTHVAVPAGPARLVLRSVVRDWSGRGPGSRGRAVPLPGLISPGGTLAAAVPVPVPSVPGDYEVVFRAETANGRAVADGPAAAPLRLRVTTAEPATAAVLTPLSAPVQAALAEAARCQHLPDDYVDVTTGWFAGLKRWVKRKVLNNFRRAYVDVLSRQQSTFNRQLLIVLSEVLAQQAVWEHARAVDRQRIQELEANLLELRQQLAALQGKESQPCAAS
ncbi:MAG: hypothetical protein NZ700_17185, partial [Gemmataceae bacterium]|nr:hypothetical protein [Gemmataceae bacterium]